MKEGVEPDLDAISPERLGINERYFNSVIGKLCKKGCISGVKEYQPLGDMKYYIPQELDITMDGIEYLQSNTMSEKAENFLKELKEMVPGI